MSVVNMLEAKSNLSRLVEAVESGAEREIVIARNGRPAAKLVPIGGTTPGKRIGVAKGKHVIPDDMDAENVLIEKLFTGKVKWEFSAAVDTLPNIHGDPFDRILIAQALAEPLRLLTMDARVAEYSDAVILV